MYRIIDTHAHESVGSFDFLQGEDGQILIGVCIDHDFDITPDDMKGARAFLCTADCLAYIFGNIPGSYWSIYETWETREDYFRWLNRNTLND